MYHLSLSLSLFVNVVHVSVHIKCGNIDSLIIVIVMFNVLYRKCEFVFLVIVNDNCCNHECDCESINKYRKWHITNNHNQK